MHNTLVLGVGNYLMGDEGIGCQAIEYLSKKGYEDQADLLDGGTGGFHLMGHLTNHKHVILIDAAIDDVDEGSVVVYRPKAANDFPHSLSTHEIGLKDLITSLTLTEQLPDLYLIAISVKDYAELRITLTKKVETALPQIASEVDRILNHISSIRPISITS